MIEACNDNHRAIMDAEEEDRRAALHVFEKNAKGSPELLGAWKTEMEGWQQGPYYCS